MTTLVSTQFGGRSNQIVIYELKKNYVASGPYVSPTLQMLKLLFGNGSVLIKCSVLPLGFQIPSAHITMCEIQREANKNSLDVRYSLLLNMV